MIDVEWYELGLHCTQDLYVTQASVVKLYSEVYVAFNQNAGDRPCGLKMCEWVLAWK
ncbi:hypothetical protein T03_370 [Trichinella britovi]|uniref:Uncharacterized protein n=1 Tax=Trichinella britovi TaxID=45882 RepID=A0A0V1CPY0_TRIBR|nr:hypothetical protein T03_370 [Trichinella britovi]